MQITNDKLLDYLYEKKLPQVYRTMDSGLRTRPFYRYLQALLEGGYGEQLKDINRFLAKGVYPFNTEFSYTIFSADIIKNVEGVRAFRFTNFSEDILTPEIGEVFALKSLSITATGGGESGV